MKIDNDKDNIGNEQVLVKSIKSVQYEWTCTIMVLKFVYGMMNIFKPWMLYSVLPYKFMNTYQETASNIDDDWW